MKYVVCFYWQGDRWQEKDFGVVPSDASYQRHLLRVGSVTKELASRYINNLYEGVSGYSGQDFKFVCFTNDSLDLQEGIEKRSFPLVTKTGVLPRMFMFSKESGLFGHQVLSLDIDVIITGSLKDILGYDGLFCTRGSFNKSEGGENSLDGDIISFRACPYTEDIFWKPFINNLEGAVAETQGRERLWIRKVTNNEADIWQKFLPGQVVSYKRHVREIGQVPRGARIISCHGHPRPHQITDTWRTEYWK